MNPEEKLLWAIFSNHEERGKMIKINKFARKPFYVDAVQVTLENMDEVAQWCEGTVVQSNPNGIHIKVRVHRPLTERQTKAFVGDWVLYAGTGYKVYTDKAFEKSFEPADDQFEHTEREVNRSAISGQYVSDEEAEENPDTTVTETVDVPVAAQPVTVAPDGTMSEPVEGDEDEAERLMRELDDQS